MPRRTTPPIHESVLVPMEVWKTLLTYLRESAPADSRGVLVGTCNGRSCTVNLAVADGEAEAERSDKRRSTASRDLDVVGQVHLTHEELDLTVARTAEEQRGRRQNQYSLPEGHVFLHVHRIGGQEAICAYVVRNHQLHPAIVTIGDADSPSDRPDRRCSRKAGAPTGRSTSSAPDTTSGDEAS